MSDDGLRGFDSLRTATAMRPPLPPKTVRHCSRCNAILNSYHRGNVCMACQSQEHERRIDAEIEEAREKYRNPSAPAKMGRPRTKPKGAQVENVKLTPVDSLPGRQGKGIWLQVVEEFLESDMSMARVAGKIHGHSIQTSLSTAIRTAKLSGQVYATYRGGDCYLVRVKK
jgi:uncharacterized Zn finger protein (UPF0148 family)